MRIKPHVLGQKNWNKGTVVERLDQRSYVVESNGHLFRRNRVHLKKTDEGIKDNISNNNEQAPTSIPVLTNRASPTISSPSLESHDVGLSPPAPESQADQRPVRSTRNKLPSRFNEYEVFRR